MSKAQVLGCIPSEAILQALSYLGAIDVIAFHVTGKLCVEEIPKLCMCMGGEVYANLLKKHKGKYTKEEAASNCLQILRVAELVEITKGLNEAQESASRGYWISKSWAQQCRRYTESQRLTLGEQVSPSRSRGRSSSELLPPWPDANAELMCDHGALGPRHGPRAKRLVVDRKTWRAIINRFPLSTKLKVSTAAECLTCVQIRQDRERQQERERLRLDKEKERRLSELKVPTSLNTPSSILRRLASKERAKRGIPTHCLSATAAEERRALGCFCGTPPLMLGRYHLVPRGWLQSWRSSLRSAKHSRPGPPPTGDLLCMAHGRPLVSPQLVEYISGRGDTITFPQPPNSSSCEIIDAEEWNALNTLFPVDFAVAFDVIHSTQHALRIQWPTDPCPLCDAAGRADGLDLHFRSRAKGHKHKKYYDDLDLCGSSPP